MKHGGDLSEAMALHGGPAEAWLDLSTGINPRSWPFTGHVPAGAWTRLPGADEESALLDAARGAYHVPDGVGVAFGPGSQALIQWLGHLAPSGAVAIVGPTYGEHAQAWTQGGHSIIDIAGARLPADARHLVVVRPNNPDGAIVPLPELAAAAGAIARRGGWMIVDEAFADADPDSGAGALCRDLPVVVLRSFGKFFGLAGLRLGFAIAAPDIVARLRAALGPWPVSGPAIAIGTAALNDRGWAEEARRRLRSDAAALDRVLEDRGLPVVGGTVLFRLVRCRDSGRLHAHLARHKIWVRSFDWAADLLRIGLPPDADALRRLAAALDAWCAHDAVQGTMTGAPSCSP